MKTPYPPSPEMVSETLLEPGTAFKKEVQKVLWGIVFFMAVYVLLVAAAVGLAVLSAFLGIGLVILVPHLITLIAGAAIVCFGILILIFLLKFIFSKKKNNRENLVEITAADEPELFAFIERINQETKSPKPKKIYLTDDVNAAVFYDSNFWSMFLPIRKNLMIGLGLVNTLSISEFKAVLAHEFGHFSQRSMKLGSYVYNANHILHDMLYNNDSYSNLLQKMAQIHFFFGLLAHATAYVAQGTQWILQKVYVVVNKPYMGLSRQMEFQADAIAASVAGGNHLITALEKIEFSDSGYQQLINRYNGWVKKNKMPDNMYRQHLIQNRILGESLNLAIVNGVPQVDTQKLSELNQSRIVVKNQWASHPSNEERAEHLNRLGFRTDAMNESAWVLFSDPEALQKKITRHIYRDVNFEKTPTYMDDALFLEEVEKEKQEYSFPAVYGNFFDNRTFYAAVSGEATPVNHAFADFFVPGNCGLPDKIQALKTDLEWLDLIAQKKNGIKTFDFDGAKYGYRETEPIREKLKAELKTEEERLALLEDQIYTYALTHAPADAQPLLREKRQALQESDKTLEDDRQIFNDIVERLQNIYNSQMEYNDALQAINAVNSKETLMKKRLHTFVDENADTKIWDETQLPTVEKYLKGNYIYLNSTGFYNHELQALNETMELFSLYTQQKNFLAKRDLLRYQAELIPA